MSMYSWTGLILTVLLFIVIGLRIADSARRSEEPQGSHSTAPKPDLETIPQAAPADDVPLRVEFTMGASGLAPATWRPPARQVGVRLGVDDLTPQECAYFVENPLEPDDFIFAANDGMIARLSNTGLAEFAGADHALDAYAELYLGRAKLKEDLARELTAGKRVFATLTDAHAFLAADSSIHRAHFQFVETTKGVVLVPVQEIKSHPRWIRHLEEVKRARAELKALTGRPVGRWVTTWCVLPKEEE